MMQLGRLARRSNEKPFAAGLFICKHFMLNFTFSEQMEYPHVNIGSRWVNDNDEILK